LVGEEVELLEDHADPLADEVEVPALLAGPRARALADVLALEEDLALLRRRQQVDAAQQRALARAARPEDADHFPFADVEVDAFQHFEVAEAFADAFQLDHRLGHQATSMWAPRLILPWLRLIRYSTRRAPGRQMTRKKAAVRVSAELFSCSA